MNGHAPAAYSAMVHVPASKPPVLLLVWEDGDNQIAATIGVDWCISIGVANSGLKTDDDIMPRSYWRLRAQYDVRNNHQKRSAIAVILLLLAKTAQTQPVQAPAKRTDVGWVVAGTGICKHAGGQQYDASVQDKVPKQFRSSWGPDAAPNKDRGYGYRYCCTGD